MTGLRCQDDPYQNTSHISRTQQQLSTLQDKSMSDLNDIQGVGPAIALGLANIGITTTEDLSKADVATLAQVRGITEARAERFIALAKMMQAAPEAPKPSPVRAEAAEETKPSKDKSESKKDNAEKGKKDKKAKKSKKKADKSGSDKKSKKSKKSKKNNTKK